MKAKFNSKLRGAMLSVLTALFALCLGVLAVFTFGGNGVASAATTIKPFALYTFEDSSNLGKDTSGNGFNLTTSGTVASALDGSDRYLNLTGAGGLYATGISGIKDFSEYITGSYTVRALIKSTTRGGAQYLVTTGRYGQTFTIVNNSTKVDVYVGNQDLGTNGTMISSTSATTDGWNDIVVVGDAVNNTATLYLNGARVASTSIAIKFAQDNTTGTTGCSYTFCIGMQGDTIGGATAQKATCMYKKVEVYNCALTQANVTEMYSSGAMTGSATVASGTNYVQSIPTLDTSTYNFNLTDKNTFDKITANLPASIPVVLSNTQTVNASVIWFGDSSTKTIKGILMDNNYLNASQLVYSVTCKQGVVFNYDSSLVTLSNVKIDGTAYVIGSEVTKTTYTLTFNVTPNNNHILIDNVKYHDVKWAIATGGSVSITVTTGGAEVNITAAKKQYKVTYYDDELVLGVSRYSYQGNETLYEYSKTGYTFAGWYTNENLQDAYKLTALPYDAPSDLKLYAKFVDNSLPVRYRVVLDEAFNVNAGTVTGFTNGLAYDANTSLNITITAKEGYEISTILWNDENVAVTNISTMTFSKSVTKNSVLMATFAVKNAGYKVYLDENFNDNAGTVTGFVSGAGYEANTVLPITVTAKTGYKISTILWNGESVGVTNTSTMSFNKTVTKQSTLVVTFLRTNVAEGPMLSLVVGEGGTVTGVVNGNVYTNGQTINATITPYAGYKIQSITWAGVAQAITNENGMIFSKTITTDALMQVVFVEKTANVTLTFDSTKGSISGVIAGSNKVGSYTISVTPNQGYAIDKVWFNGTLVSVASVNGFEFIRNIETDLTIKATFKTINLDMQATVTLNNDANKGTVSGVVNNGVYALDNYVVITINANTGYVVSKVQWNDTIINVSPNTETFKIELMIEDDSELTITYEDAPVVEGNENTNQGGSTNNGGQDVAGCSGSIQSAIFPAIVAILAGMALVVKKLIKKQK